MKKVLFITRPIAPPWDEASKNFAYYLARNLNGFDVGLLTEERLPGLPENISQIPIYTSKKLDLWQKFNLLKIRKFINDFDIIHFMLTPNKLNSFAFKTFLKSKRAKTIQTVATLREDLYSNADFKKILFADLIITYSDYAKNKLNSLGFKNVERIYPGIDLEEYKYSEKLTKSDFVINFTGEYARLGAINLVIDSFIEISKKIPHSKLDLAVRIKNDKDAKKKKEIIGILKKNNLSGRVDFHDNGNYRLSEIYNLADISMFPVNDMQGKFDIPLAVIEAMACEKPVILSDLPILAELNNGQNSVIIEKGNAQQLTRAVLDLYDHPEKRAAIGKEARAFVEEKFDIKKIAEKYKEIYRTI